MEEKTSRKKIIDLLLDNQAKASELSSYLQIEEEDVLRHLKEITNYSDYKVLVMPPKCRECGFENFDNLENNPSKCPSCNSTALEDMVYSIEKI